MAVGRYATYTDILSRAYSHSAFHSVSNGAVNVEFPKAKTAGSEKAVEVPSADKNEVLQSVQAIIKRMLRRLDEWSSAPAFSLLPLPVESPNDETTNAPANLLPPKVAPASLLQSSPPSPPRPQFTTNLVSSDVAPTLLLQSTPQPSPQQHPVSSLSRVAKVWSMTEVKKVSAPKRCTKRPDVAFSPINLPLATTRADKNRSLWDVETGEEFLLQEGHDRSVYGLSFPREGSLDRSVRFDVQYLKFQRFYSYVHVLKLEYEPPPNKESYLGSNLSLEGKAVLTAVQLICIGYLEWWFPKNGVSGSYMIMER